MAKEVGNVVAKQKGQDEGRTRSKRGADKRHTRCTQGAHKKQGEGRRRREASARGKRTGKKMLRDGSTCCFLLTFQPPRGRNFPRHTMLCPATCIYKYVKHKVCILQAHSKHKGRKKRRSSEDVRKVQERQGDVRAEEALRTQRFYWRRAAYFLGERFGFS